MTVALNGQNGDTKDYTTWIREHEAKTRPHWSAHEAPVTYTAKWRDESGLEQFVCLRGDSLTELLPVIKTITTQARQSKDRQHDAATDLQPTTEPHNGEKREDWCRIHRLPMAQKQGKYGAFYSHKIEGGWCQGKETRS